MSRIGVKWAYKTNVSPPARKFLLVCLAELANDSGEVNASQERLMKATGMSRRTVINQLNALVDDGYLLRFAQYRKNGRRAVNTYCVGFSTMFRLIKARQVEAQTFDSDEVADDVKWPF